jgi:hypothetical protein
VAALVDVLLSQIGDLGCRLHADQENTEAASAFDTLQRKHLDLMQKIAEAEHEREQSADERATFDLLQRKHVSQTEKLASLELQRDDLACRNEQLAAELADVSRERDVLWRRVENSIGRVKELELERADVRQPNAEPAHNPVSLPLLSDPSFEQVDEAAIRHFSFWMARKRVLFGLGRRVVLGRKAEARSLIERSLRDHGMHDAATAEVINWLSSPRVILGLGRRRLLGGMHAVWGQVALEIQQRIELRGLTHGLRNLAVKLQHSLDAEARRSCDLQQRFHALEAAKIEDEKALLAAQVAHAKLSSRSNLPTMAAAPYAGC